MEPLSPTGRVILGMLGLGPMSGYEIKSFVDHSTRFFWAASYGQIYPELRKLAERADRGRDEAQGGRNRTVHRLTPAGGVRSSGSPRRRRSTSRATRACSRSSSPTAAGLARSRPASRQSATTTSRSSSGCRRSPRAAGAKSGESCERSLRLGIALQEFIAEWCERELADVRAPPAEAGRVMLERLAELAQTHRRAVVIVAVVAFAIAGVSERASPTSSCPTTPTTPTRRARSRAIASRRRDTARPRWSS